MPERLTLYDLLSALIPGALLLFGIAVLFPTVGASFHEVAVPEEFAVVVLLAGSMVAGQIVQTLGSLLEPALYRVRGGRPSDLALSGRPGRLSLPRDTAERVKAKLKRRFGAGCSDRSLFLGAKTLAEHASDSKAAQFNTQYSYHRSVFALFLATFLLIVASRFAGASVAWTSTRFWLTLAIDAVLTVLLAMRTWQRGAYYAREVLLAAERVLDTPAEASSATATSESTESE